MHRPNLSSLLAQRSLGILPLAGGVALLAAMIPAAQASAATSGCTTSGNQVTCVFLETGAGQTWTVPAGVTSAMFTLYGAEGGAGAPAPGGLGAEVTATLPSLTPGTILQVNVGQAGGIGPGSAFGGGGSVGPESAGAGGGASDIRSPAADGSYPLANRLLVAGAGGGGGIAGSSGTATAGAGGNADSAGSGGGPTDDSGLTLGGGGGGGGGTATGPGAGGAAGTVTGTGGCSEVFAGQQGGGGGQGTGGGGAVFFGGGGGGGGYFGGGGGGGTAIAACSTPGQDGGGGGGGGGSSYTGGGTGATVADGVAAPDDAPNGEVIITYAASADLSVTNSVSPNPVVSGNQLTYTITATNTGGQTAQNATVTDPLPASVHYNSASATQGTCTRPSTPKGGAVTCSLGSLGGGDSATVTIVVTTTTPGTLSDTATTAASNVTADADDSATATTTVTGT